MNLDRLQLPFPSLHMWLALQWVKVRSAKRGSSMASLRPHNCKILQAERLYIALLEQLQKHMPTLAHWERQLRIGDFLRDNAKKMNMTQRTEWYKCFGGVLKLEEKYKQTKKKRDDLIRVLDAKLKKVLDFYDNKLCDDLAKHHPLEDRLYVMNHLLSGLALLPFPSMAGRVSSPSAAGQLPEGGWFNDRIFPTMCGEESRRNNRGNGKWEKVLTWKRTTDVKDAYVGIVAKFAPLVAVKAEDEALKAVTHLFAGRMHHATGKPILKNARASLNSTPTDMNHILGLTGKRRYLAVSAAKKLPLKQIDVVDCVYHIPVLNGIFATIEFVATMRAWKKDKKLQDVVGTAASVCGIAEAAVSAAAVRQVWKKPMPAGKEFARALSVRGAGLRTAAKVVGRVGAVLGLGVSALDAREASLAGDDDAAAWACLAMVGGALSMASLTAPIGIVVSIVAAIGYALAKDSDLVSFAKTSCYGIHGTIVSKKTEASGYGMKTLDGYAYDQHAMPCRVPCRNTRHSQADEKSLNKLLEARRKVEAKRLREEAKVKYATAGHLRTAVKDSDQLAAAQERDMEQNIQRRHGPPPSQGAVAGYLNEPKENPRRAKELTREGIALERKAYFLWGIGTKKRPLLRSRN